MAKEIQFPGERSCVWELEDIGNDRYQVHAQCGKVTKTSRQAVEVEMNYCPFCGGKLIPDYGDEA